MDPVERIDAQQPRGAVLPQDLGGLLKGSRSFWCVLFSVCLFVF